RSSSWALSWYERRRHLLTYPLIVGCQAGLLLIMHLLLSGGIPNAGVLFSFLMLPLLMAPIGGAMLGRSGTTRANPHPLSAFQAIRPVTTAALTAAKLRTVVLIILAAWGILLSLVLIWFVDTGLHHRVAVWWRAIVADGLLGRGGALVVLTIVMPILLTWRLVIDSLCASLT